MPAEYAQNLDISLFFQQVEADGFYHNLLLSSPVLEFQMKYILKKQQQKNI